jgi:septin family protein
MADSISSELELDEEGTRISLTIVDTPGFGDQIDNEARYKQTPSIMCIIRLTPVQFLRNRRVPREAI